MYMLNFICIIFSRSYVENMDEESTDVRGQQAGETNITIQTWSDILILG